ncbi:MAG TPA: protease pro-enzyme activation domain-containing protein [Solirubrobacteraceae bacterium]|nr:protease pro-enzyme activation domain-containing protein [Solirubrobacteraceae bacterium]
MRLGAAPRIPAQARVVGSVAPASKLQITIALAPRDPAALQQFATAVSTPSSPEYRNYITPAQFASRFGPTAAQIAAVQNNLRSHGLTPGTLTANHLSLKVTATAGAIESAMSTTLDKIALPGGVTTIVNRLAPRLDAGIAPLVQAVVGLDGAAALRPLLVRRTARRYATTNRPQVVTGGPQPCAAAITAAPTQFAYTADQLASAYTFSSLYQAGDQGHGQTIALYELEPDDPNDIATFQSCYGTHASVAYTQVDGGAGSGPGSGEAALDIETVIGLAPQANVLVYQAPNSNSSAPGAGPYDDFAAIIAQDRAQIVSVSWGQCEGLTGAPNLAAEGALFEEAAAQGQTIVAASGDSGSEGCYSGGLTQALSARLAVVDPASQPFVTGAGGTTTSALGPRPSQTVWNGGGDALAAANGAGAGGGGVSAFWHMPAYQSQAPASLGVLRGASAAPCGGAALCREVPDVSSDADPFTGLLIYWNGSGTAAGGQPTGWQGIGGTSVAAPTWAAMIALTNSLPQCHGIPIGFANPALYEAAASAYATDFNDVTSGNNDLTGLNGSQFPAAVGYDMASGLGTPNAAALGPALCAQVLRLVNPGTQATTARTSVTVPIRAQGGDQGLQFSATGLPRGLAINPRSGTIAGTPNLIGTSTVTVTAHDAEGESAKTTFRWAVFGAPSVSRGSIKNGRLKLTVAAGRSAPALVRVTVAFPRSFHERSKVVTLRRPVSRLKLTARVPKTIGSKRVTLTVTVTDLIGDATRLPASVRVG